MTARTTTVSPSKPAAIVPRAREPRVPPRPPRQSLGRAGPPRPDRRSLEEAAQVLGQVGRVELSIRRVLLDRLLNDRLEIRGDLRVERPPSRGGSARG